MIYNVPTICFGMCLFSNISESCGCEQFQNVVYGKLMLCVGILYSYVFN